MDVIGESEAIFEVAMVLGSARRVTFYEALTVILVLGMFAWIWLARREKIQAAPIALGVILLGLVATVPGSYAAEGIRVSRAKDRAVAATLVRGESVFVGLAPVYVVRRAPELDANGAATGRWADEVLFECSSSQREQIERLVDQFSADQARLAETLKAAMARAGEAK